MVYEIDKEISYNKGKETIYFIVYKQITLLDRIIALISGIPMKKDETKFKDFDKAKRCCDLKNNGMWNNKGIREGVDY